MHHPWSSTRSAIPMSVLFQILEVPLPILVCMVADPEHHHILVGEPCHHAEGPAIPPSCQTIRPSSVGETTQP